MFFCFEISAPDWSLVVSFRKFSFQVMTMMVPDFRRLPEDWHVKAWWLTSLTSWHLWHIQTNKTSHSRCKYLQFSQWCCKKCWNWCSSHCKKPKKITQKKHQTYSAIWGHETKVSTWFFPTKKRHPQNGFVRLAIGRLSPIFHERSGLDALLKSGSLRDCLGEKKRSQRFVWQGLP